MEKNSSPNMKLICDILEIFLFLFVIKISEMPMIAQAYFSIFKLNINEVKVEAMLLPKTIPILWLNVKMLALISAKVIIIRAELD